MLDAVTNGESFEDFAIDSDDENNLQDLDLGTDFLDETVASNSTTNKEGNEKIGTVSISVDDVDAAVGRKTKDNTRGAMEHPLQMIGVDDSDPLSQVNSPAGNAVRGPIYDGEVANSTAAEVMALPNSAGELVYFLLN